MGNSETKARARELASRHTPGSVLRKAGEFLENVFFGVFAVLGWVLGRAWFLVFCIWLAFLDGLQHGAKPAAKPAPAQIDAPQPAGDLLDDDRIIDAYQTPFGVPYGPNVHASHD